MDSKFTDLDDEYLQNQIDKYRKKKIVLYIIFLLTAFCGVIMFAFGVKSAADNSTNPQFYLIAIGGLVTLASLILLVVSINLGRKQKIAQMTKNKRDWDISAHKQAVNEMQSFSKNDVEPENVKATLHEKLDKLTELRKAGHLSDEEFIKAKKRVLEE